jgi:hypothetical protein
MESEKKSPSAAKLYVILMLFADIALGMIALLIVLDSRDYEEALNRENNAHESLMRIIKDVQNKPFFGAYAAPDDQQAQAALQQFVNAKAQQAGVGDNIRTLTPSTDSRTQETLVTVRIEKLSWEKLLRFIHAVEQGGRNAYAREMRTDRLVRNPDNTTTLNASIVFAESTSR